MSWLRRLLGIRPLGAAAELDTTTPPTGTPRYEPPARPKPCVKLVPDEAVVLCADGRYIASGIMTMPAHRVADLLRQMDEVAGRLRVEVMGVRVSLPGGIQEEWRYAATCPCDVSLRVWLAMLPGH